MYLCLSFESGRINTMSNKISIRFYNDHEVRAVWDEGNDKWWFSAIDIVRAINNEPDYVKAGNYWRWLKKKLANDGIQLVSVTHDFKLEAPDGKRRAADALDKPFGQQQDMTFVEQALTDKIHDREIFMKGIDYSYYYEQEEGSDE